MNLRRRRVIFVIVVPLAFGLLSLALGRDANWDLRNYHWYNPYTFLTGRYDLDIAPAGLQSFLTPLLDIPWFILGKLLPGPVIGFLLGAVHSLNLILLYYLAYLLLPFEPLRQRNSVALWVAIAGMLGASSIGLLGTTYQDNVVSIGVLASLLAVLASGPTLANAAPAVAARRAAVVAVPVGLAVAGKLTALPYAVGLAVGFLFLSAPLRRRAWLLIWFGTGLLCVTAVAFGPWMWHLWKATGSPLFPYFSLPGSPVASLPGWLYAHFLPRDWVEALIYPFVFSLDTLRVGLEQFRDYRIAAAYVLVPLCLLIGWYWRRDRQTDRTKPANVGYVVAAVAVAYVMWLAAFSIYRYAVTLEMLAPLLIAVAVATLPFSWQARAITTKVLLLALLATTWPLDWGRARWTRNFIEVEAPVIARPDATLVLLLNKPLAYIVPAFPPQIAFIQLVPELARLSENDAPWNLNIRARLERHRGDIFGVIKARNNLFEVEGRAANPRGDARALLSAYGLQLDEASCRPLPSNFDQEDSLISCDAFDFFGLPFDQKRCHPSPAPADAEISAEFCKVIRP